MNFIRNKFSTSQRKSTAAESSDFFQPFRQTDFHVACFETYQRHWIQLEEVITNQKTVPNNKDDCVLIILNHLEHIISLIRNELEGSKGGFESTACLSHMLKNDLFYKVFIWSKNTESEQELAIALAEGLDTLLAASKKSEKHTSLLRQEAVLKPIRELFQRYVASLESNKSPAPQLESVLVTLCHYVCVLLAREPAFFGKFYNIATVEKQPGLPLMSILINSLYNNDRQGQTAREGLKILMCLAKEQQLLTAYTLESSFCPIVATGLSPLFSALPHVLPPAVQKAGMFSSSDVDQLKEVKNFVTALEFCDSVLETAPALIVSQLLDYCYNGFLVPVLSPALFQDTTGLDVQLLDLPPHANTMREILASTCYLTLCIRRIRNRGLIGIFIRFLLTHVYEGMSIIEVLINRLSAQTELRLATLELFSALIDLNCEDVMLALTMKHLLPCSHVMVSQRGYALQENDTHCLWAAKFLSLVPSACNFNPTRKPKNAANGNSNQSLESEHSSRIRSWSKASDESDEGRYGQLSFVSEDAQSDSHAMQQLNSPSPVDIFRLRRYLSDDADRIRRSVSAGHNWKYLYNGQNPTVSEAVQMLSGKEIEVVGIVDETKQKQHEIENDHDKESNQPLEWSDAQEVQDIAAMYSNCLEQLTSCLNEMSLASPGQSSGYESFNFSCRPQDSIPEDPCIFSRDVQEALEFWSMMREDDEDRAPSPKVEVQAETNVCQPSLPTVGPFLETLVRSVDGWLNNSIEVNLALCAIISRLACYPQPLLRSFLLNPYLILQPSIPGLASSIATLKQRIDCALNVNENARTLIQEARLRLDAKIAGVDPSQQMVSTAANRVAKNKPSLLSAIYSSFVRKGSDGSEWKTDASSKPGINGYRYNNKVAEKSEPEDHIGSHVAVCAVLLEEWLHELAALCLEHAVHFTPHLLPLTQL